MSVAYGVGIGVWFSSELRIKDPATFLIPPIILGLAAPVGVYALDHPAMPKGLPAATAAGMFLGAAEGTGIVAYQFVTSTKQNEWGFRGLSRATALGATLGGVAGYTLGYFQEPAPESSVLLTSTALWGTAIGAMYGFGVSPASQSWNRANDAAGLGGLIGFNAGAAAGAVLSLVMVPSGEQLGWMWAGGGIGAAASLPIFLFYAGKDTPPAKRGFIFMATATTVGILAGGIFGSGSADYSISATDRGPGRFKLSYVVPKLDSRTFGVELGGELF
ncbi:MAG TPA: hypothetical protein VGJ84_23450 [Polyangiaceae bacterium]